MSDVEEAFCDGKQCPGQLAWLFQPRQDKGLRARRLSQQALSASPGLATGSPSQAARTYFPDSASRSATSLSSSAVCWAIRSAILSSFWPPETAAACSTSWRILSRRIAIRSSSSESERLLGIDGSNLGV